MIIYIITFVFPVLTYSVRLIRKKYEEGWGRENYNREPNYPSSTFRWMSLIMNALLLHIPVLLSFQMTSNSELPIDGQMFLIGLIIDS